MLDEAMRGGGRRARVLGLLIAAASACGGDDTSSTAASGTTTGTSAGGANGSGPSSAAGSAGSGTAAGGSAGNGGSAGASGAAGSQADSSVDSGGGSSDAAGDIFSDMQDVATPCGRAKEICCSPGPECASDAGVTLTCSVDFCLDCANVPAYAPGCTNVALGGVVTAQREVLPDDAAIHANDGNVCTSWSSNDYADIRDSGVTGTFLQIDLQATYQLDSMTFWIKSTPNDADVTLKFEYSTDGVTFSPWQAAAGFTQLFHDNDPWLTPFQPPIAARYFKVTFLASPSYIAMRELALFTCPPGDAGND